MKLLIITAALAAALAPAAQAETLGAIKDCDKPISEYGMQSLSQSVSRSDMPAGFTKTLTGFCENGKTFDSIGYEAMRAKASALAKD
ncbi:hypothetical protein [Atlantibacter hermannii]|uniref:hypothetical protein n=1 Tax=Atlantibacter hermannii TaxID=565 RepID=UPI0028B21F95|nr:hypothetical protein [Atlantibacter hermannii]